jgi:hypothetical protein
MPTPDASLAFNSGLSDLIVADPLTDGNQIRIRGTSNLHVSWEINNGRHPELSGAGAGLACRRHLA